MTELLAAAYAPAWFGIFLVAGLVFMVFVTAAYALKRRG